MDSQREHTPHIDRYIGALDTRSSEPGSHSYDRRLFATIMEGGGDEDGGGAGDDVSTPRPICGTPPQQRLRAFDENDMLNPLPRTPPSWKGQQPPPRSPIPASSPGPKRRPTVAASRILDARGMATTYDSQPLGWATPWMTAAIGNAVYLWAAPANIQELLVAPCSVTHVASSLTGATHLAVGRSDGRIHLYSVLPGSSMVQPCGMINESPTPITALDLVGNLLCVASGLAITLYEVRQGVTTMRWKHQKEPLSTNSRICVIRISPTESHIAIGTDDELALVRVSTPHTDTVLCSSSPVGNRAVAWMIMATTSTLVYGGGPHGSVISVTTVGGANHVLPTSSVIVAIAVSRPHLIIVAHGASIPMSDDPRIEDGAENGVTLYDWVESEGLIQQSRLRGHSSIVYHLATSADGSWLVTGAGDVDATIRLWKLNDTHDGENIVEDETPHEALR